MLKGSDAEVVRYPADEIRLLAAGQGDIQIADYVPVPELAAAAARHGVRLQ